MWSQSRHLWTPGGLTMRKILRNHKAILTFCGANILKRIGLGERIVTWFSHAHAHSPHCCLNELVHIQTKLNGLHKSDKMYSMCVCVCYDHFSQECTNCFLFLQCPNMTTWHMKTVWWWAPLWKQVQLEHPQQWMRGKRYASKSTTTSSARLKKEE